MDLCRGLHWCACPVPWMEFQTTSTMTIRSNSRRHLGKTTAHPGQLCPGRPWLTVWVALVRGVLPIITKRVSIDPIVSTCRISPAVARRQDSVKDGGSVRIIKTRLVQPMRTCSHSRRQSRVRCLPPWPGPQSRLVSSLSSLHS